MRLNVYTEPTIIIDINSMHSRISSSLLFINYIDPQLYKPKKTDNNQSVRAFIAQIRDLVDGFVFAVRLLLSVHT